MSWRLTCPLPYALFGQMPFWSVDAAQRSRRLGSPEWLGGALAVVVLLVSMPVAWLVSQRVPEPYMVRPPSALCIGSTFPFSSPALSSPSSPLPFDLLMHLACYSALMGPGLAAVLLPCAVLCCAAVAFEYLDCSKPRETTSSPSPALRSVGRLVGWCGGWALPVCW